MFRHYIFIEGNTPTREEIDRTLQSTVQVVTAHRADIRKIWELAKRDHKC